MTYLMITDEQARQIAEATSPVVFVDPHGRELGKLKPLDENSNWQPLSEDEIAELRRRLLSPGPGKTTKELLDHLKAIAPVNG